MLPIGLQTGPHPARGCRADDRHARARRWSRRAGGAAGSPSGPVMRVQVDRAEPVIEPVWRLTPEPAPAAADAYARMHSWLGRPISWAARPEGRRPLSRGGRSEWWRSQPGRVSRRPRSRSTMSRFRSAGSRRSAARFDFAAPGGQAPPENPWLLAALEPARAQPWSLWRARLASSSFGPIGAPAVRPDVAAGARDSIVARLGEQHASVWSIAIQWLAAADRNTAPPACDSPGRGRELRRRGVGAGWGVVAGTRGGG